MEVKSKMTMIWQDANQVNTWWCIGKLPEPQLIITTAKDYWLTWVPAPFVV